VHLLAGSSCVEKPLLSDHIRFQKVDISSAINGVTTCVHVEKLPPLSTFLHIRQLLRIVLLGAPADKRKLEDFKDCMQAAPATRFIPRGSQCPVCSGSLSCTRMDERFEERSEAFKLAEGKGIDR
jgi:hypothetical protein